MSNLDIETTKEHLQDEITRLANFLLEEFPGEGIFDGAVNTAIRKISELKTEVYIQLESKQTLEIQKLQGLMNNDGLARQDS